MNRKFFVLTSDEADNLGCTQLIELLEETTHTEEGDEVDADYKEGLLGLMKVLIDSVSGHGMRQYYILLLEELADVYPYVLAPFFWSAWLYQEHDDKNITEYYLNLALEQTTPSPLLIRWMQERALEDFKWYDITKAFRWLLRVSDDLKMLAKVIERLALEDSASVSLLWNRCPKGYSSLHIRRKVHKLLPMVGAEAGLYLAGLLEQMRKEREGHDRDDRDAMTVIADSLEHIATYGID